MVINLQAKIADVDVQIRNYGTLVRLIRLNRNPASTTMPWRGPVATPLEQAEIEAYGVFLPARRAQGLFTKTDLDDSSTVKRQHAILMVSALSIPEDMDAGTFNLVREVETDRIWQIDSISEQRPSTFTIYIEFELSR